MIKHKDVHVPGLSNVVNQQYKEKNNKAHAFIDILAKCVSKRSKNILIPTTDIILQYFD